VIPGGAPSDNETHIGQLAPVASGTGGGFALQLVSPQILDFVMVIVNGLDDPSALPMRVQLVNDRGRVLRAGRIDALDANGGAEVYHQFRTQGPRRLHHRERGGLGRPSGPDRHGRPVGLAFRGQRSSSPCVNEPAKFISADPSASPGIPSKVIEMSNRPLLCVFNSSCASRSTKLVWVTVPRPR
jgi:hypothetical protein